MTNVRVLATSLSYLIATAAFGIQATCAQTPAAAPAPAGAAQSPRPVPVPMDPNKVQIVRFEAIHGEEADKLSVPRLMAAAIVAQDKSAPRKIADVGAYQGEFLEAFMERFPNAQGLWTDPIDVTQAVAKKRLARFGDRVTYKLACLERDISDGCIPKDTDVILTSWDTPHQPLEGIVKLYEDAHAQLPPGGWLIVLDHLGFAADDPWGSRLKESAKEFHAKTEGPPPRVNAPVPTLDQQMAAFKVAGFDDVQMVWRSFTDVLFMAKK
jgi:trans-aconitate methyltransferase